MELFDPAYQPWTGGGRHFAFFNQPEAAQQNFHMFWKSVRTWHGFEDDELEALDALRAGFPEVMQQALDQVWRDKLGLPTDQPTLVRRLMILMQQTPVDYTILFRSLSDLPETVASLQESFYQPDSVDEAEWSTWLKDWHAALQLDSDHRSAEQVSERMKQVNPKYLLREWLLEPTYKNAAQGDIRGIHELQAVMTQPYETQDEDTERRYFARKPLEAFGRGGVCHMTCSS